MDFQSLKKQLDELHAEKKEMKRMIQQLLIERQKWNEDTRTQTCTSACVSSLENPVVVVHILGKLK